MELIDLARHKQVINLTAITPLGVEHHIDIACHNATMYWLLCAREKFFITGNQFLNSTNFDTTGCIRALFKLALKTAIDEVNKKSKLNPGSIIVFERAGQPLHSCIAITEDTIAGFNQTFWYTTPGVNHGYSTHRLKEVKWQNSFSNQVLDNQGNQCSLYEIPQELALHYVRSLP